MNAQILTENVDFKVIEKPVRVGNGVVDGYHAVVREDTGETLAINGSRYKVVDHRKNIEDVAKALYGITPDFTVTHRVEKAKIYSRFTLNQEGIFGNSKTEGSTLALDLQNSYDGSLMFGFDFSVWRKVCSNGMFGLASEKKERRLHTANINVERLIAGVIPAIAEYKFAYENLYDNLRTKPLIPGDILENKFTKKLMKQARENYHREHSITNEDSAWTQLNAFTRSLTHDDSISETRRQELSKQVTAMFTGFYGLV